MSRIPYLMASAALLGACGDAAPEMDEPASIIGGSRTLTLETDDSVVRAELFLDDTRIAIDDSAPFELVWDTRNFTEGPHRLRIATHRSDGSVDEQDQAVHIDNTTPQIQRVSDWVDAGGNLHIWAEDNVGIAAVEVVKPNGDVVRAETLPYVFSWISSCTTGPVTVRVVDRAGWVTEESHLVQTRLPNDLDCDGFETALDCNDREPSVHPGAVDPPGVGVDANCDGIAGNDADGDGVPPGFDCDEADPAVHGEYAAYRRHALPGNASEWAWSPGNAVLDTIDVPLDDVEKRLALLAVRDGALDAVWFDPSGGMVVEPKVAVDVNPGSLASVPGEGVVYGRGNEVHVARWASQGWSKRTVATASGTVGATAAATTLRDPDGLAIAFQVGGDVFLARRVVDAEPATTVRIASGVGPVTALHVQRAGSRTHIAYATATQIWVGSVDPGRDPEIRLAVSAPNGARVAAMILSPHVSIEPVVYYAINWSGDGKVYHYRAGESVPTSATWPYAINSLVAGLGRLFVHSGSSDVASYRVDSSGQLSLERHLVPLGGDDILIREDFSGYPSYAARGVVRVYERTIAAAPDAPGGVDADCNGAP